MVGRNDPCPCGSGKKFKKCHSEDEGFKPVVRPRRPTEPVIKGSDEIEGMRRSGRLAARILHDAVARIKPGTTTNQINDWVHEMTLEAGAYPSPLNYPQAPTDPRNPRIASKAFPKSVCTSVNNVICHGIPDETALREGDIINVDVTCNLEGFHGDTSVTAYVGIPSDAARLVTETSREALARAMAVVRDGALFSSIGDVIEGLADSRGLSVVREFTGHGIGRIFHEPPAVLHYRDESMAFPMRAGMIFTIEPMLNVGSARVKMDPRDHWTARTLDGSLSAQFEHTVLVTESGCEILTLAPSPP